MRYSLLSLASCLCLSSIVPVVHSSYLRHATDGGLEFEVDLAELPQHLTRHLTEVDVDPTDLVDGVYGREYEYEEGSNPSLLNQVLKAFIPLINRAFVNAVPDPLPIPLKGSFKMPELNLFGYCKANAGFNVSVGTLTGLKGLSIERMQVFTGTERINVGWNINAGCLETLFSTYVDMEIKASQMLAITDMNGGFHGSVCSFGIDEYITGGMFTVEPRLRGAINITGSITGSKVRLNLADIRKNFKVGYERIEAYIDDAPPTFNQALANITGELSIRAKDDILDFIMRDELIDSVSPQVSARARESIEGQTMELETKEALGFNTAFLKNQMSERARNGLDAAVNNVLGAFESVGLAWNGGEGGGN